MPKEVKQLVMQLCGVIRLNYSSFPCGPIIFLVEFITISFVSAISVGCVYAYMYVMYVCMSVCMHGWMWSKFAALTKYHHLTIFIQIMYVTEWLII